MKKVAVGVDIGGTNSVYGLVDEAGEIICEGAFPTRNYPDFDQYIEELYIGIQDLLKRAGDEVELVGIGIGAPNGNYYTGTIEFAPNLVWKGAKLIGANSDVSGPIENGIVPACRALVAPIEMATGTQAYFCGKPNPLMMRTGLRMLHCHSAEAVMVGDRMDTDVISGMESGMSTVLVLSGVSTRETIKTYAYRPSMVLNGVGDIVSFARGEKSEA